MPRSTRGTDIFPERLLAAREKRGLSQGELGKRAGFQASAISHFETGTRKPSFDNLRRLADALDVTTDYLLGRVTDTEALAGADTLHRHLDQLTTEDREMAKDFLKLLAHKAKTRTKKMWKRRTINEAALPEEFILAVKLVGHEISIMWRSRLTSQQRAEVLAHIQEAISLNEERPMEKIAEEDQPE